MKLEGVISISAKGTGYVKILSRKEDVEIDFNHLNTALHGDLVEIALHPKTRGRDTGEVVKVVSRAKAGFAGELLSKNGLYFVKPDDTRMYADILIPKKMLHRARAGQKVFVEIISWLPARKAPEGKIVKVLGRPGENDAEMQAIALEKGFGALPKQAEEEARKIKRAGIQKSDYSSRRDMRKILTFTIDPQNAKDFDDAISFREITSPQPSPGEERGKAPSPFQGKAGDGVYEVGIHIADVSHYVQEDGMLDREARERGTSVYLVDRTIPMLPEILSNDLCSLVPGQDRLTMSTIFILDKEAKIKSAWFGRTVIHSQKRFTYEEAEETIKKPSRPLHRELAILNQLAKKLTHKRFARGAISLEQEEVRFVLDEHGKPLKVERKERGDANRLVEELMLLANRKVAEVLSPISIYRVHDLPSKEKMADLAFFLESLGFKVPLVSGIIPSREINKLLARLANKDGGIVETVHRAVIRSMAKAVYSTKNIGHYGLAFGHYTHFTSPIRRYPDILVHRLLTKILDDTRPNGISAGREKISPEAILAYEQMALVASEQERRAAEAERTSIKYKQAEYMSGHLGKSFEGVISGVTEWGFYVEEAETKCEGLVRVRDLSDDFYVLDEKKLLLRGEKKKKVYRLGDRVRIKVKAVDLERKTIDYVLI